MLTLCVEKLLRSKGIEKPYAWLRKKGFSHNTTNKLLSQKHLRVPLNQIETICREAWCTPSDLMEWIPDDPLTNIPEHPLQALKPKVTVNILPDIAKLSPAQLAKLQAEIKKGV